MSLDMNPVVAASLVVLLLVAVLAVIAVVLHRVDKVLPEPTLPEPSTPKPKRDIPSNVLDRSCLSCRHTQLTPWIPCYGEICRPCLPHPNKPNWTPRGDRKFRECGECEFKDPLTRELVGVKCSDDCIAHNRRISEPPRAEPETV